MMLLKHDTGIHIALQVQSATTTEQLQALLNGDDYTFRFHCGYTKPSTLVSLDDKEEFARSIWLHFVLFQPHAELEQLRKGPYQTLQFELLACAHPKEVWGILAASTVFDVTPQHLCDSFVVHYSDNGSNNRNKEEAVIFFWFEYVSECAARHDVTVQEIVKFMSGSSKIPATGFDTTPKIRFTDSDRLPTVSTCEMSITFPRGMGLLSYEEFKDKMDFCILGSYGFGVV